MGFPPLLCRFDRLEAGWKRSHVQIQFSISAHHGLAAWCQARWPGTECTISGAQLSTPSPKTPPSRFL